MYGSIVWARLVSGACAVCLLVACGAAPAGPQEDTGQVVPATVTPGAAGPTELGGTQWRLVEYGPADAPVAALADPPITITFEAGDKLGGSGGCNSYGGAYEIAGSSLSVGEVVSTMRACVDAAAMQQEATYLAALDSVTSWERAGDELILAYDGGNLHFARQ